MTADSLSSSSRAFYERSRGKLVLSILIGAASMMLLGFCSDSGGRAAFNAAQRKVISAMESPHQDILDGYRALIAGYGFASFTYIVSFILLVSAAIYTSPLLCGSKNEVKMMRTPQELDSGGGVGGYSGEPYNRSSSAQSGGI